MREIKIDLITLIAVIAILGSLIVMTVAYYFYTENECVRNPVEYAQNHSENYWWDTVIAIQNPHY